MPEYRFDEIAINSKEKKKPTEADKSTYIGLEHLDSGSLTVTRWGSDIAPIGEKLVMHKGDVLFGKRRAYQKKVAIAPFDGIFSAHGMVLRPKEAVITRDFFPLFISSDYFLDKAIKISVGSLSPTINWNDLKELVFTIPTIEEQRQIASLIWAAIKAKQAYNKLLSGIDDLVKSQFIERFESSSNEAEYMPLKDCCKSIVGGNTPSMKHPEYYGGNIPFIKSGDVKERTVSFGALSLTDEALENTSAKLLPAGTVLVVVRSAALQHEFHAAVAEVPVVVNQDIKGLQVKDAFLPEYIMWALISNEQRLLSGVRTVLTSHIETKDLLGLPIRMASKEEQTAFCDFVKQSDKSKFELTKAISRIDDMIKALMQR